MRAMALFVGIAIAAATAARAEDSKIPSDEEVTKKIVGKWGVEKNEKGATGKLTMILKKDGSMEGYVKMMFNGRTIEKSAGGTWKVEKGVLLSEITKEDGAALKSPIKDKDTITAIGDKELKLKDGGGKVETWTRDKE